LYSGTETPHTEITTPTPTAPNIVDNNTEMITTTGPDDPYYSVLSNNIPPSERAPYQPIDVRKMDYISLYTVPRRDK